MTSSKTTRARVLRYLAGRSRRRRRGRPHGSERDRRGSRPQPRPGFWGPTAWGCRHALSARSGALAPSGSVCPPSPEATRDSILSAASTARLHPSPSQKICHGSSRHCFVAELLSCRTQEVQQGTADTNCRAAGQAGSGPDGAVSSTRGIQQCNQVTEGKGAEHHQDRPGEERSPGGYARPRIGRWSPVTHTRSPQPRPLRRKLRIHKAGAVGR